MTASTFVPSYHDDYDGDDEVSLCWQYRRYERETYFILVGYTTEQMRSTVLRATFEMCAFLSRNKDIDIGVVW